MNTIVISDKRNGEKIRLIGALADPELPSRDTMTSHRRASAPFRS